jgi:hypothetical protein
MTRGHAVEGDGGESLTDSMRGDIRIWAGSPTQNGVNNLMNCPFYVTNQGFLKANNAEIVGKITATDSSFRGSVTATSGYFSNCTIDSTCTVNGTLNYSRLVGNMVDVPGDVSLTNGVYYLPNDTYFAAIKNTDASNHIVVYMPSSPVKG